LYFYARWVDPRILVDEQASLGIFARYFCYFPEGFQFLRLIVRIDR